MPYAWERLASPEKTAILRSIADADAPVPPPRVVELSWQDRCNIDCFFCSTAEIRAGNYELSRERQERNGRMRPEAAFTRKHPVRRVVLLEYRIDLAPRGIERGTFARNIMTKGSKLICIDVLVDPQRDAERMPQQRRNNAAFAMDGG